MRPFEKMTKEEIGSMYELYAMLKQGDAESRRKADVVINEHEDGYFVITVYDRDHKELYADIHTVKYIEPDVYEISVSLFNRHHQDDRKIALNWIDLNVDGIYSYLGITLKELEEYRKECEEPMKAEDNKKVQEAVMGNETVENTVGRAMYVFGQLQGEGLISKHVDDMDDIEKICEGLVKEWEEGIGVFGKEEEGYITVFAERSLQERFGANREVGEKKTYTGVVYDGLMFDHTVELWSSKEKSEYICVMDVISVQEFEKFSVYTVEGYNISHFYVK